MNRLYTIMCTVCCMLLCACVDDKEMPDTPQGNFEALWKIMDEHYCFFDAKGVNWDKIHDKYRVQISSMMTDDQLFEVFGNMIGELKDGHTNLSSASDYARYWNWHEDYPRNFSDTLQRIYMGNDYKIAAGMYYRILDDNIGYIYYGSFENGIGDGNLDEILQYLMLCNGLIIDVRNNGGGNLTNAAKIAARFTDEERKVGYIRHKTGMGHNDFSDYEEQTVGPAKGLRWHKKVAVLTNRSVFSAANEFVKYMKQMPTATIIGDRTGGGAGLPLNASLPNGWRVRFSACPMYDAEKNCTEDGIEPDIKVSISDRDFLKGRDTIIEAARQFLSE